MVRKKSITRDTIQDSMEKNIKDYANEIKVLASFVEGVREVPGMYIGHLGDQGFLNMFREIYQNSVDEMIKKKSPCNEIYVFYDENTHEVIIEDNGRGYPFELMIDGFTNPHVSSNFNKEPYEYSSGRHGVGSKATNALSDIFIVESYILGEARRVEFHDGVPWKKGILKIKNPGKQGTKVYFHPSYQCMGNITLPARAILDLIVLIVNQLDIGAKTVFTYRDTNGKDNTVEVVNTNGIITFLNAMNSNLLINPIVIHQDTGYLRADICISFDSATLNGEVVQSFANTCPCTGTHLSGFMSGVSRFFKNYMNKIYLANNRNKKLTITEGDIKAGLRAVVSVFHLKPTYNGQAKEELDNKDMYSFVNDLTYTSLDRWGKDNPTDLQKVCKLIKEVAEIRLKADEGKIKLSNNYKSSLLNNGMPAKYHKPNKKRVELWICEGDSAAGSIKTGRNPDYQGVFPIRGKLPNAFSTPTTKMLKNEEISAIITIINGGYGKNFNISTVPWEKVILAADADVDGAHIANLFLCFCLLYMKPLVEAGRVYRATPPLFGMQVGNSKRNKEGKYDPNSQSANNASKHRYFATKMDYVRYCQQLFSKSYTIVNPNGKKLSSAEIIELVYKNEDYVEYIENISNTFAIHPDLLELVLINYGKRNFKHIIESAYRFLRVEKINGVTVIEGTVDKSQTVILNDRMLSVCSGFRDILLDNMNIMYYNVNGQVLSLYRLMKLIESITPAGINRYKGLGEMGPIQLYESTMDIHNRTLIRYTVKDIEDEIEAIRYLESNKAELLKNTGNIKRRDLE